MKSILLMMTALLSSHTVFSAESLTLSTALEEAKTKSPQIRQLQEAARGAEWRRAEALSSYLPRLSLQGMHSLDEKFQVLEVALGPEPVEFPLVAPFTLLELKAGINLFDGFRSWAGLKSANLSLEAAQLDLSRGQAQLEADISLRFYQALGAQILADVADQNIKTLEDHLADVRRQVSGGVSTSYDLLRVEVQLSEARTEKLSAQDNVALARMRLAQAMGLERDERALQGELPVPSAARISAGLSLDAAAREDFRAQQAREEAASEEYTASKSYWYPKLELFADNQWYNNINRAMTGPNFKQAYSIGVNMSWNLFDGGASISRQKQVESREKLATIGTEAYAQRLPVEFETWKRRYLLTVAQYQARIVTVEKAKESVRLARAGRQAGARTNAEVLDAELDLFRSRAGVVRAQIDSVEALSNLELALGKRLSPSS